jgi:pyruvate dehydrogenase E2 component (dihydrolipoamide acetyltransferase)
MAEVVTMLALSPTMDEGTLAEWSKNEGDAIEEGEVLAEVETDKATMEMESFFDGTLLKQLIAAGDAVPVGAPIAIIGEPDEDISGVLDELETSEAAAQEAGADEPEAGADEPEAEAAEAAAVTQQEAAPRRDLVAGQVEAQKIPGGRLKASPLARRMADEEGLELRNVEGTGPGGRIIKRDIEAALEARPTAAPFETAAAPEAPAEKRPLSQMRKTIARRLREVWQSTPHFTLTMSIDMGRAMAQRKEINAQLEAAELDAKISVNDMIVKACALALREYPAMNVAFQGDHLLQYNEVHVGVAVAVEEGLITPTIRHADHKGLRKISQESRELAVRARDKKLTPEEYTGGTFTVSNLGMYGIDHFMAVINPPQAGILACGAVKKIPVVEDGELAVGTRMSVTLSCDHRAVDGAMGAEYLNHVKRLLENPVLLMI